MKSIAYLDDGDRPHTKVTCEQLFDLRYDRAETSKLSDEPGYWEQLERLRGRFVELRREVYPEGEAVEMLE